MAQDSRESSSHVQQRRTPKDEIISLRLFQVNWTLIAVVFGGFCLCLLLTDFRIEWSSYLIMFGMAAIYGIIGHLNAGSEARNSRIYATLLMLAQFIMMIVLITSLGYIAAAANLPMQEDNLLALDRRLGFDFGAYLKFVSDRPILMSTFTYTYGSIHRQLVVLMLILPLFGHHRRAAEFALAFAIALIVTTIISALTPAIGAYHALGIQPADYPNFDPVVYYGTLKELPLVRDGTTRLLNAYFLGPVLTFPSFHAISAILYVWALWPFRWLRAVGLLWNAVMVAATPIGGGHFLADVAAGLIIAVAVIWAVHRIGRYFTRHHQKKCKPLTLPVPLEGPILRTH
ncbi:phosphatase PAP2 family protein [Bradyrhizobium liaoningense]|uniref:phosphatase PAP2 family protein n=1 Tax=Bradyrhizobium liaoningense TaxID=43992 RepID=UPI001BAD36FF|nr:phosphatase PAP2 family protein [Bradyrhizobium liaoningense]MBR0742247.1 phosphatase PAP2 family protein [Bradyrhizobium liaoningense]